MLTFKGYISESVGEAINDLVDRIKTDGYTDNLEKKVADEWEINPALLVRMFKQKYNKEPKEMNISNDDSKIVAAAKKKAAQYRGQFSGQFEKYVDEIFVRNSQKLVFVAWTGKDIHAITIPAQKEVRLVFKNTQSAQSYLEKNIIKK